VSAQANRLPKGGRVDRAKALRFTFDGQRMTGHPGDTLASALLANGIVLVGRSYKYHRPRGILSAGAEEPNALIQLGQGARTEPNLRATQIELFDGLIAESQNRWPSLKFDLMAINSVFHRLFPAGFYYKTFMWPKSFWMKYEHVIRNIAGLGKSPTEPDPDRYDKRYAHCDVLVVGAGPTGLSAALAAGRAGARVILVDEQQEMGGSLLSNVTQDIDGRPAFDWVASAIGELRAMPEVQMVSRAVAFAYYDHNMVSVMERVTDHLGPGEEAHNQPRQRLWRVRAKEIVLATGAIERPLVYADNDRPGCMLASAARTYVNRYAVAPGKRAVIMTNNDSAYLAALDLQAGGVMVAAIVELRAGPNSALIEAARARNIEILPRQAVTKVVGKLKVEAVTVHRLAEGGRSALPGEGRTIYCDMMLSSGGWQPTLHLHSQTRAKVKWDDNIQAFVPGGAYPGQRNRSAGGARGQFALATCLAEGHEAGRAAAAAAGVEGSPGVAPGAAPEPDETPVEPFWIVPSTEPIGRKGKHFIDYQNDATAADVMLAHREGFESVEHLKRYTTMGMATDQGKTSNVNALALMADLRGIGVPELGVTTYRPPYTPVTIGAFAGIDKGDFLDPIRKTALHQWHESNGAKFETVGQWHRAWYYPRAGETMHQAVNREVKATRTSVGIFDASTLGKIDIQGPDAAWLLNMVYTNAWSKLEPGKCRYGLMLGEDGMVMDDGVTSRQGENHFHMTTTTGGAARVMAWLEDWLQCEWPERKVYLTSVTEQWSVIALNGPLARKVLSIVAPAMDLSDSAFPFLSFRDGEVAEVPARIFRISFTGELSFEINLPPSYAVHVWQALMRAGEEYGITPYGTEAMHVLRAEKGFVIVGQETDGTATPGDLGMDWIVSKQKADFLGRRSLARADTKRPDRKHLVGLLTENPNEVLPEGAQVVADLRPKPPMEMIGHVTSSYWSPNCGRSIAMAMVKNGRNRMGETVYLPYEGKIVRATVTEPKFFDLEGARING
jgi:sarcosine oxidase subunit alpha